jgi:hypothetical protein
LSFDFVDFRLVCCNLMLYETVDIVSVTVAKCIGAYICLVTLREKENLSAVARNLTEALAFEI